LNGLYFPSVVKRILKQYGDVKQEHPWPCYVASLFVAPNFEEMLETTSPSCQKRNTEPPVIGMLNQAVC